LPSPANLKTPKFRFEPLDKKKHNRAAFSCEHERLNTYLKEQANQEIKKRVTAVYVLTPDGRTIAGYYTLSQYSIDAGELPPETIQKLGIPKYPKLPATLLERLARSREFKGAGVGELLLMGALRRALDHSKNIASLALVVDAKDEKARAFHRAYGLIDLAGHDLTNHDLANHPSRLFLPMRTIEQLFFDVVATKDSRPLAP
jgi:acetyltransferase (GNAT) family protein